MSAQGNLISKSPDRPARVVIPLLAGIGNSIMAIPMIRQIKQFWPSARITVLARSAAIGEPVKRLSEVDEVLITGTGFKALMRAMQGSRSRKPDIYLVPFPSNRWQYGVLALTSGAKRKILHSYPVGHWRTLGFIGDRVAAKRGIHDVVQNLRLLEAFGFEPDLSQAPTFATNETDRDNANAMLRRAGVDNQPFIAVHAGSASTILARAKRWPAQSYARLIQSLQNEFQLPLVLLEGPDEKGVGDEIASLVSGVHVSKLSGPLGDTAAVLERAKLYIGSDSGLAHLAAAVGTPPITLFAPADPERVCPFGYRHLVVQPPCECSPCFMYPWEATRPKMRCAEPMCVTLIEVETVLQFARSALQSPTPVPSPSGRGLG